MIRVLRILALSILTLSLSVALHAQFAAPGHIAILQGDAVASNTTCTILEFNTTDAGQSFITSKAIPGTGTNAFRMSGSAGSTGYLANTDDGTLLCFVGANNATTTGNSNVLNPRGVGVLDGSQNFSIATTYTGTSGNQSRGVTSIDNLNWFIADQGGIYTNGAVAASPAANILSAKSFGGTVYVGSAKLAGAVSTVSAASGGTITALPGLTTVQGTFTDFYLISSGSNGASHDILYTIGSDGTLSKYSLVSGVWTANGTYTTANLGYGMAAKKSGAGAELYISSGNGTAGGNSLMKYTDDAGYNAAIAINSTVVTLYTAPAAAIIKGVAFTPTTSGGTPPVTPSVNLTVSTNTASEAAGTVVTVTATASAAVSGNQTMTLTVSGTHITATDYSLSGAAAAAPNITTITIPNGATTGTATFTVLNDTEVEDPETAVLTISSPSSGITLGTATQNVAIADDDVSPRLMRITEYMYGGANGEFIEFTNVGASAIDMTGWSFSDNGETPGAVSLTAFGIVKPGESVILTETAAGTFRTDWALCNGQKIIGGNTTNLGRADEINLYDQNELLVDRLTYDDQTLGGVRANNASAWVSPAALGKNISSAWTLSTVGDGEGSVRSVGNDIGSPGTSSLVTHYSPCVVVVPGAPTVGIDVASTSDLIDGGITASPDNSFAVSGVTNDPTDPASTLGVAITIGDDATPVDDLTFTVTSSNLTVVPAANLILTGTGASRLLKIIPAAKGYSDITLTVGDGTSFTTYTLNYAASTGVTTPVTSYSTGISDASAALPLDDNFMVIGDDEHNLLYVFNRNISGQAVKTFDFNAGNLLQLTDGSTGNWKELDIEAATTNPVSGHSYWLGSMSNSSSFNLKPNRDRLIATDISGTDAATTIANAGWIQGLRTQLISWGDSHGYNFSASAAAGKDPKTIDGFNAEGMVFAPDNTTMYIGLRAPLVPVASRTKAVIAPIANFETWFNAINTTSSSHTATSATIGTPIELDLGGRGIRDLVLLPNGKYLIVAGSWGSLSAGALYLWTGVATDAPSELTSFDITNLNAESALPVYDAGHQFASDKLQMISDDGDVDYYGDGAAAKDLGEDNLKKFSTTLSLSSSPGALPVEFESFTAIRQGTGVQLDWKTGIPRDVASFDVLRSTNGTDFSRIATVPAIAVALSYTYADANTPATRLYYRIRANEFSGSQVLSTIRVINPAGAADAQMKIYPNPVTNGVFTITTGSTGVKTVNIYTSGGSLFQQMVFAENAKDVSTASWPKGYYLVRLTLADGSVTIQKLVVQ
ncbi:MAG TPA: DUF3616 domain-containing protein [Puia sp.]|nr:DUF3616 domain-containing protein [Puia sp.]